MLGPGGESSFLKMISISVVKYYIFSEFSSKRAFIYKSYCKSQWDLAYK